jgi:hypothetical protein
LNIGISSKNLEFDNSDCHVIRHYAMQRMVSNFHQMVDERNIRVTTDGRKNLIIRTGPKTPPPPVAVEALPTHQQQSIKRF